MYGALFAFWGVRYSWQTAAESQRPPRGSALACPHCLAGDRSDTEANTCSSEDRDLAKRWPLCNPPIHTHNMHSCTHMPNVYHPPDKWHGIGPWGACSPLLAPSPSTVCLCLFPSLRQFVWTPQTERLLHQYTGDPESTRASPAVQMFSITGTFVVSVAQ